MACVAAFGTRGVEFVAAAGAVAYGARKAIGNSLVESSLQAAQAKLEVTKERLKSTEEQTDSAREKLQDINCRLQENLKKMIQLEKERATHAHVMKVLQLEVQPLGQLKDLLSFLQAMTNFFDKSIGPNLQIFVERANKISNHFQRGITPSDMCIKLMYQTTKKAVMVNILLL